MKARALTLGLFVLAALSAAAPVSAGDNFFTRNFRYTTAALDSDSKSRLNLPMSVPDEIAPLIVEAATKNKMDPKLIAAVAFRESRFDPRAVSSRGAIGVMQLMPRTARALGVKDAFDARQNIMAGTAYLKSLATMFHGDLDLMLAAYNAGPQAVQRLGVGATQEAVEYVAAIRSFYLTR